MKPFCHWTAVARQGRKWRSERNAVWQHCCLGWNISFSRCSLSDRAVVYLTWDSVPCEGDLLGGTTGKKVLNAFGWIWAGQFPLIALWLKDMLFFSTIFYIDSCFSWFFKCHHDINDLVLSNRLIVINRIQIKVCVYIIRVYCVYLYVYINTHTYMYIFKKHLHVYIYIYIYIYIYS